MTCGSRPGEGQALSSARFTRRWIALSLLLFSGCGWFGWGSTPRGRELKAARRYLPAEIEPRAKGGAGAEKLQVRIWATEDFQRVTLEWQSRLYHQLERVNEVLRAALGVELEVEEVKTWPAHERLSSLEASLFDLEQLDPGENADIVIGLITPLPVATSAIHELGRARVLGKHLVLRGSDDAAEVLAFERAFSNLSAEEREEIYVTRRRHKEEAVLLHELGHLFGALHVAVPTAIMRPLYDHRASGFAPVDLDLMKIGLSERHSLRKAEMIEYLEKSTFDRWIGDERIRMLALLTGDPRRLARASDADILEPDAERAQASVPDPVRDATVFVKQGDDAQAWRLLEPIAKERMDDAKVVNLSCGVAARLKTSTAAEPLCRRALELVPDDPGPALYLGLALLDGHRDGAEALAEAERRLVAQGDRAGAEAWGFLARLHQQVLSVTLAEQAAARAVGTEEQIAIAKWAAELRADFGLEPGALSPDREGDYLRARARLKALVDRSRFRQAKKAAAELATEFPGMPGPDALFCRLFVLQRVFRDAAGACDRAVGLEPRSIALRVLMAYAAFGARRPAVAIPHLEQAILLDPTKKDLWSLLASAYRSSRREGELADLEGRYRERFGEQLR